MESEWASHAFQQEATVLSIRLRPYSCGHEILLSMERSPYLLGGKTDWHDLFTAVLICSQNFADGLKLIRSPRRVKLFAWIWRLSLKLTMRGRLNLIGEGNRFSKYLEDNNWSPPVCEPVFGKNGARRLKAPKAFRLVPFLCSHLHLTEAQAFDFPMARAQSYQAAVDDKAGMIDLEGEEENNLLKFLEECEAKVARGEMKWD